MPNISDFKHIAIIILNWNGKDDTLECLKSLTVIPQENIEIIIADNGSKDASVEAIRREYPHVTIIENNANLGFAEGNNRGISYALEKDTDAILLLNNDTTVDPNFVNVLLEASAVHDHNAILTPKILQYYTPELIWYAGAKWNNSGSFFQHVGFNDQDNAFTSEIETDYACGCCMFIPRKVLNKIGLMDAKFFLTFEETDWCYRAKQFDIRCFVIPGSKIYHKISTSFGGRQSPLQEYFFTRNALLWGERHLRKRDYFHLVKNKFKIIFPVTWHTRTGKFSLKAFVWSANTSYKKIRTDSVQRARFIGLVHYFTRRFGDCPDSIRELNTRRQT